jgi:hypothetical protein
MNALLSKAAPYVIAIAVGGGWWLSHNAKQRQIGAMRERLRVSDSTLAVREAEGARLDTVFRRDTIRLTRVIQRTTTLLDTLLHSDTVTLTQRESVLVFVADSLVGACTAAVDSCTALNSNLIQRLQLTEQQRDAYRVLIPTGFQRARGSLRDALIGAAITYLLVRN